MRENGKRFAACLLAVAVASLAVAGCQVSEASSEKSWESQESTEAESVSESGEAQGAMENLNLAEEESWEEPEKWEEPEPEKITLSPEDYESWNQLLAENEISEDFARSLDEFAYESGSAVLRESQGNGNYSPLSLYYALALAGCGAKGDTAAQIMGRLGAEDSKELADQCRRLYQWYGYYSQREQERMAYYGKEDYQSAIQLGNSLWISDQLPVHEAYRELAAENFFAPSFPVDFKNSDTGKKMGGWIAKKTNGVMDPQIYANPETLLAIINTLYFYGGWADPFPREMTKEDAFHLEEGGQVTVSYLNRTQREGAFKRGDGYTLSYLNTNNGCRMVFLLPEEGRTVGEFLESPERLREAMEVKEEEWVSGKVIWKIPKFNFGSSYSLNETLKAMGMEKMFDGQAEFGGISPAPLMVSSVVQVSHIGVDENGVEGAAYTMMAMGKGVMIENGELAEMILDRPFLFGIREEHQEVWLFLGVCRNPDEGA